MTPTGTMCSAVTMTVSAAIAMTGLKLRAVKRVGEVAEVIRQKCVDQRKIRAKRRFEQEVLPSTSIFRLPSSTMVPTPVGVSTPPRPQPPARMRSTKRALRHQVDRDLVGHHLLLYVRIEADVARGQRRDQRRVEQLADALAGDRGVIADDGEFGLPLPDQFVQQALRRSDPHESTDHDGRAVGDHGDRFFHGDGFHFAISILLLSRPAAVDGKADAADLCCCTRAQEGRDCADLVGGSKFERGLLLGQELHLAALTESDSCAARSSICFCTSGVRTQPGQMALQVTPLVAVSSATTFVSPRTPCLAAT